MAWHYLKRNHSNAVPSHVVFLDTETIQERHHKDKLFASHHMRCGCCISGHYRGGKLHARTVLHFDDNRKFWSWLDCLASKQYTTWIVAHKMSFDFGIVGGWTMIDRREMVLDMPRAKRPITSEDKIDLRLQRGMCVIDDPPFILGLRNKRGGRLVFVDTLNWFRCTLAELGESIDLPKLEMPPDTATINHWRIYCERDVEIVERAFCSLIEFNKENDCGMFRYTAPSQAMAAFRHASMSEKICLHDEHDIKKLERRSYFGGDTRVFYSGRHSGELFKIDVNGLYPHVMRDNVFPVCLIDWNRTGQQSIELPISDASYCIADVEVSSNHEPYRLREDGKVAYCVGRLETTLAGPELKAASERNDIVRYKDFAVYDCLPIFREYVDKFQAIRCKYRECGNRAYEMLAKLMLNSLYGKFGQQTYKWEHRTDLEAFDEWSKWVVHNFEGQRFVHFRSIGPYVFQQMERGEHSKGFCAISSFVTAYGREYMRKLRNLCGDCQVFYQGVDSLIITQNALEQLDSMQLLHPTELGKLKIVSSCTESEFRGANNYIMDDEHIISGVKLNAKEVEPGKWYQTKFENCESQIARKPTETIRTWDTIFTERLRHAPGSNTENGWLQPVRIGELFQS